MARTEEHNLCEGAPRAGSLNILLERSALEYWNVIHIHRANRASQREPADITDLLRRAKDAMDEAQKTYNEHLGLAHATSNRDSRQR